jgi:hypothetical protein
MFRNLDEKKAGMERTRRFLVSALLLLVAFCSSKALATDPVGLVETISTRGHINWSTEVMTARGKGVPPEKYYGTSQAPSMALQAAQLDAYRNLFEVTKRVRIDMKTTVGDVMAQDASIEAQMREMIKCAQIVKREYLSDGTVEVTLAMSLCEGFAQLVLPKDVKQLPEIKTILSTPATPAEGEQVGPVQGAPTPEQTSVKDMSRVYTGLVLDVRGLNGRPALSPKIFDENGEEVYGSAYVSREFAVQHGMAGYAIDLPEAKVNPRVADTPFTVKGLRTTAANGSDFVISNSDAAEIRSSSQNLSFLRKCRVMIVLDPLPAEPAAR